MGFDADLWLHRGDRLKQLRAFCYSAELSSMSKAADRLALSQPAVSQQIRALETDVADKLFERRGPKIALTPAGESLYKVAMPLVRGIDGLPNAFVEELTHAETGEIHVAAGMTATVFILPERLRAYREEHPGVTVRVTSCEPGKRLALIRSREADLGIGAMSAVPDDLAFHAFVSSRLVCIAPTDHPLANAETMTAADVSRHPVVLPARGSHSRTTIEMAARHFGCTLEAAVEVNGWSVIKRYVEAGLGMAFVPDMCLAPFDRVRTIPFEARISEWIRNRDYGLIVRRGRPLSRAARRFAQSLAPGFRPDE